MSEQLSTSATDAPDNDTITEAEAPKPTETLDFWKAKARENERRAKSNADAARRLAEIEDAQKTEVEKTTERVTAAERRAAEAEAALLRYEVAAEKEIPAKAIRFLVGSTREEIEASAKEVLELLGDAGKPRPPKPDPNQGRAGAGSPSTGELFAAAVEGSFTR